MAPRSRWSTRIATATAQRADHFLQLRPGTDVALVLSIVHVLEQRGLLDRQWIDANTTGVDDLLASAREMPTDRASSVTGLTVEAIEALAVRLATARPSAIRVLVGPEHREHGRDIMRAIAMVPALTGAWRDRGGGLARSTQVYFEQALALPEGRPERRRFNMAALGATLLDPGPRSRHRGADRPQLEPGRDLP